MDFPEGRHGRTLELTVKGTHYLISIRFRIVSSGTQVWQGRVGTVHSPHRSSTPM